MDIRRLELLRELADRGSVTAVARATHRTASAVSQQLKVLEREAGVPLTERSGRGIHLTAAGRELARTATDVAIAIERAEAVWEDFRSQPRGEVTLATFPSGGQMLLPGLLTAVDALPGLTLACSDLDHFLDEPEDLTADFDVVVIDSPDLQPEWTHKRLSVTELMWEPLDVALPENHPLGSKRALKPGDLTDETWIGVPAGLPFDRILRDIEAANGTPARIAQRIADNGVVEALVAAGHGIAILPRFTTRDRENGLITRPLEGIRSRRLISALTRPDRAERPSVRAVVRALSDIASRFARDHATG
ncbi:DNA-binding transcriptional LysR family regulator [Microbacteriaceae bacterium SG_E_30_P1]|uniref:DNA-binding transcriptional LysR family regulator n=1 Tax=Antiquaquibacter oligotrophicus TaxID=2880260 RepID=A0ABT6KLT9_9MICO|nr:LysR family transcriptional regulator [Antiquaquibacter oligotrophicus]MDH6180413.1 DNA-binding transcriptional LysR family regulator [Antiquaquibacter oligotrophicus]UDF13848.1 LysR family transcriptional regulator [Antiquaquibacter oligotrophicus]